jgi:hypothetical protein
VASGLFHLERDFWQACSGLIFHADSVRSCFSRGIVKQIRKHLIGCRGGILHCHPFFSLPPLQDQLVGKPTAKHRHSVITIDYRNAGIQRREYHQTIFRSNVPDGMVHHWVGIIFIPHVTLAELLPIVQDYDRRSELYKPEVTASRLISHQGDDYRFFLRLSQKRFTTVVFNTEYVTHWGKVDPGKAYSRTISTRIAEVKDSNRPDGEEWPVGEGRGYLWRLNTYWRFEEKDDGVYMQCEALSLTRDIPLGLGWLLRPLVTRIPRESLNRALGQTRAAVLEKKKATSLLLSIERN